MLVLSSLCRLMILGVIMISNSVRWLESPLTPNRKPNPGMIFSAKKKFNLNLKKCFVVGDRDNDIKCGKKAGCKTVLLKKKYNNFKFSNPDYAIKYYRK